MDEQGFLFSAFVFLVTAVLVVPLAKRGGLGSVLGYLIAGIAIGPFGLTLISDPKEVLHFAEFGVVMMLFLIGLELEPRKLWRMRRPILGLGGAQVAATAAAITAIAAGAGLAWQTALAIGLALALSSTAMCLQILNERNLMATEAGRSSFSVLLFQDVAVIPILALLPLLAVAGATAGPDAHAGATQSALTGLPAWLQVAIVLGGVAAIVAAGRFLFRPALAFVARSRVREIFTAFALALVIGIALLMQTLGLSPALGTFLAGVVLASSEYRHQLESDIEPFKGLLLGLFFISVGMSIDFDIAAAQPGLVALLLVGLVALKFVILYGLGRIFGIAASQSMLFAVLLAQGGEFAFVLFQFATVEGAVPAATANLLVAVVALSMATTPIVIILHDRLVAPRLRESGGAAGGVPEIEDEGQRVIVGGFGRVGQVVSRLLNASGVGTTVMDHDPSQIDLVRRFGNKAYYGDVTRLDMLRAAGAETAEMLIVAIDDEEQAITATELAKQHFPHLTVVSRARNRPHAYALMKAGADVYRRETFHSAVEMGSAALRHLGFADEDARKAAETFAEHDISTLLQSFEFYEDDKALLSFTRKRREDLERVMSLDRARASSKPEI